VICAVSGTLGEKWPALSARLDGSRRCAFSSVNSRFSVRPSRCRVAVRPNASSEFSPPCDEKHAPESITPSRKRYFLTKLNYEKLRHLPRATAGASSSVPLLDLSPVRPLERLERHNPFPKWCRRCRTKFPYEGVEERPPLIRCCSDCRSDLEYEAGLNGIDRSLPDDVWSKRSGE
jgi:hypothetical protein